MFLFLDAEGPVSLRDALDFKGFKLVIARSVDQGTLAVRLAGFAKLEGDAAWIDVAELRRLGPSADNATWQDNVSTMLAKAAAFGWVSADGLKVRAHIERGDSWASPAPAV